MTEELHKRLEEAAKKYADENYEVDYSAGTTPYSAGIEVGAHDGAESGFLAGAEFGYKEAIKAAKEWMEKELDGCEFTYGPSEVSAFVADFETDMNKLWEDNVDKETSEKLSKEVTEIIVSQIRE